MPECVFTLSTQLVKISGYTYRALY